MAGSRLGKAPPCGSYEDLTVLSSFETLIDGLDTATTSEEIKQMMNSFRVKKAPNTDLEHMQECDGRVREGTQVAQQIWR